MTDAQTTCTTCGTLIRQFTADRYQGLCVLCDRDAAAIPPDDFKLPSELLDRIKALGQDPDLFLEMTWCDGVPYTLGFLNKIEESQKLHDHWAPRLRAFAKQCRLDAPPPSPAALAPRDLAKLPIYEASIRRSERITPSRRSEALFCSIPLIAIPVALRCWPGEDERTVVLTPDEWNKWQKIYKHPDDAFWWFSDVWWRIDDPPNPGAPGMDGKKLTLPEGETPWLVTAGLMMGPMSGGSTSELWSWNGTSARFVEEVSRIYA